MDAYTGEVRVFGFNYPPSNWAQCTGQLLPIRQFVALYSLLGVQFGGDGSQTFGLPDYRGRVPLSIGTATGGSTNWQTGMMSGTNGVTLDSSQLPIHNHGLAATSASATTATATSNQLGMGQIGSRVSPTKAQIYSTGSPGVQLSTASIQPNGGGGAHNNLMPFLGMNICICLNGIFPPRP